MENTQVSTPVAPVQPVVPATGPEVAIPKPRRRFPVRWLLGLVGILVLLGVLLVVARFATGRTSLGGDTTLVWWGLWEEEAMVAPVIADYEAAHPGVKITYIKQSPQDYRERLQSALASGSGPDIFRFHSSWVPMFSRELAPLPADVMTPADFTKTFYPVIVADLTRGADILGMPLQYDGLALFVNDTIFAANGKTPPTTWVEFRQLASQLTTRDETGNIYQSGAALGNTSNVDYWPEILALMMQQNGTDMAFPASDQGSDALAFFTLFTTTDKTWDETLPPSTRMFADGRLAMYFAPMARVQDVLDMQPNLRFHTVPLPQLPKDTPDVPDKAYASYWVEGVSQRSAKKQAAWDFLAYMASVDALTKLNSEIVKSRPVANIYPRRDMAGLQADDPLLGPVVAQAGVADSWYLASRTFDGPTGINSQLISMFKVAVDKVVKDRGSLKNSLNATGEQVYSLLKLYRLVQ